MSVHLVTDSGAQFVTEPAMPVTVVPLTLTPQLTAPAPAAIAEALLPLTHTGQPALIIHTSGKVAVQAENWAKGIEAVLGRVPVQVIDSGCISTGLGAVVTHAATAAAAGQPPAVIFQSVRRRLMHVYGAFFADLPSHLGAGQRLGAAHTTLGDMLGIKPFLTFEEGALLTTEKAVSRAAGVEQLAEFVGEFAVLEHASIVQATPEHTADTAYLLELLAEVFPDREWPVVAYNPALAAVLGPNAMGAMVIEGESVF